MKIEKNIPIPYRSIDGAQGGKYTDLFKQMQPGDSFEIEQEEGRELKKTAQNCRTHATHWASRHNSDAKFKVRKLGEAYRCWRIE